MADLPSWNDTPTRQAIIEFVERVARDVPVEERVAVFDNDGTLWCEKPMQIEIGFLLERLAAMADTDASLRERQPWKAAHEGDHAWMGGAITKHYQGDDGDVKLLIGRRHPGVRRMDRRGVCRGGRRVPPRPLAPDARPPAAASAATRRWSSCCATWRPTASRATSPRAATATSCARSRTTSTASRPSASSAAPTACGSRRTSDGGSVVYLAEPDVFDDGPVKPIRIWSRIGRRPLLVVGNANGDIPFLRFAGGRGARAADRSSSTTTRSASSTTPRAPSTPSTWRPPDGWTVASVRDDWATVFA